MAYETTEVTPGLPSWWGSAVTVKIQTIASGTFAVYDKEDVEFFPYGIGVPDNTAYDWGASIIPRSYIASIIKNS